MSSFTATNSDLARATIDKCEICFMEQAALQKVPRLAVAITPIAPIGLEARPCCANTSQCEAVASPAVKPQWYVPASSVGQIAATI